MSRPINQPVNQVRLTNVAVVRMNRGGKRFEVACYRNKVVNYRQGTETDLSEVLQTDRVFTNVSKGQFAKSSDLAKCFGTSDEEEVCRRILTKGDVQVSDMERSAQLESITREVASMVSEKCVDPASNRPYTAAQVRDAMKRAGFMVHPTRNAKQQFLDCVRLIQARGVLSIERAKMELAVVLQDEGEGGVVRADGGYDVDNHDPNGMTPRMEHARMLLVDAGITDFQPSPAAATTRLVFRSDPSAYREVESIARDPTVRGRLEIVRQSVTEEGDVALGSELERRREARREEREKELSPRNVVQDAGSEENEDDNDGTSRRQSADDDGDEALSRRMQSSLVITEGCDVNDNTLETAVPQITNSRKSQKAAQKKSKKAKRREKEERADREERVAAEKARQRERAERLGIDEEGGREERVGGDAGASGECEGTKGCNTCGGSFSPSEYRSHFRSDWHRYNVKLKMQGVAPVNEREFKLCDSDAFFE